MIEYRDENPTRCWSVTTIQGDIVEAWPVASSAEEAMGVAVFAIHEILGNNYILRPPAALTDGDKWLITAEPTVHGYPEIKPVEAYILPTTFH